MNDMSQQNSPQPASQPASVANGTGWMALAALAILVAAGGWIYQSAHFSTQLDSVKRELTQSQKQITDLQGQLGSASADAKREVSESVSKLNEDLQKTRKEAQAGSWRAQSAAKQQVGKVMTALNAKNEELVEQIGQLKKENTAKSTEVDQTINGIKGDVGEVKTEVASTKADLDNTKTDFRRALGDMGVMSGLIATNASELAELKKLGERNYIEFTLPKNGGPQKVGDIQIALRKTDMKRNRFTFDVVADDKKVEKKDKTVNEPVQFYLASARVPYEVVVNSVSKDSVKGYLSIPKVKLMAQR